MGPDHRIILLHGDRPQVMRPGGGKPHDADLVLHHRGKFFDQRGLVLAEIGDGSGIVSGDQAFRVGGIQIGRELFPDLLQAQYGVIGYMLERCAPAASPIDQHPAARIDGYRDILYLPVELGLLQYDAVRSGLDPLYFQEVQQACHGQLGQDTVLMLQEKGYPAGDTVHIRVGVDVSAALDLLEVFHDRNGLRFRFFPKRPTLGWNSQ